MKQVLVIANNLRQASYRVRIEALLSLLANRGISTQVGVRTGNWLKDFALYRSAAKFDAVLLQRKLLASWEARVLRRAARRIVYDVDDAVMYQNRPVGWLKAWQTTRRFRATAKIVDHVVAGNAYLADLFHAHGPPTTVLPTVVDPARYGVKAHTSTASPRLVWIGSRSTLPYLALAAPAIAEAARRMRDLGLITIADATISDPGFAVDHRPWSAETESESLQAGDIGIAPTPTDRWTLGKCGFKIVQYMAAGLPVIASPVGANAELVRENETGYLPRDQQSWVNAIERLSTDVDLRQRMGQAGRRRVETELCLSHVADEWAKLL